MKRVIIVGGGFAGLNAARELGNVRDVEVLVIDRRNHHLFQPLLYQVAMAGLSPAEIAAPIRALLSGCRNIRVLCEEVTAVDLDKRLVTTASNQHEYDYLLLACGARHTYFKHPEWEEHAPGLKTIEQATEIRRRVLSAFEEAEREADPARRKALLTFVIVGGGPTGVELAGAIGEMSRFTLARDFRNVDPKLTRVILVEAGPRILPMFSAAQASRAVRDLEALGVQVWTSSMVTDVGDDHVDIGKERIAAATTLWAAGVEAVALPSPLPVKTDRQGRIVVGADLSLPGHPEVFVAGDGAHVVGAGGQPLSGVAPVALQQGRFVARAIQGDLACKPRGEFRYVDKGQMATIGRSRAIVEIGRLHFAGFFAWIVWLVVHIYYLVGFKNRLFVVIQWAWSYLTFRRGARLIVGKEWRFHAVDRENGGKGSGA
jgi:NADH dehydrogenase